MMDKLLARIQDIMTSQQESRPGLSFERLLFYLSHLYKTGVQFRSHLYKKGILKARTLPCFVISIGNITAGGTGKTPMALYLSEYLTALGYKVAIVTRGYKGKLEHKGGIVSDGNKIFHSPEEAGDEAYMMAQALKLPVIAGKKRFDSCMTAIKNFSPDVIVLDDAFQHLALKRNLNLLLFDAKAPLGNRYLLPRGTLREPISAVQRSDAIIYTRSDRNTGTLFDIMDAELKGIPMFKSIHCPFVQKIAITGEDTRPQKPQPDISSRIKGKRAFLFSGIANNSDVKHSCETTGLIVQHHVEFPDHHNYTQYDIDKITNTFKKSNADFIVTTQKDYVKISNNFPSGFPIVILDIQIKFDGNNKTPFETFINEKIKHYFYLKGL